MSTFFGNTELWFFICIMDFVHVHILFAVCTIKIRFVGFHKMLITIAICLKKTLGLVFAFASEGVKCTNRCYTIKHYILWKNIYLKNHQPNPHSAVRRHERNACVKL